MEGRKNSRSAKRPGDKEPSEAKVQEAPDPRTPSTFPNLSVLTQGKIEILGQQLEKVSASLISLTKGRDKYLAEVTDAIENERKCALALTPEARRTEALSDALAPLRDFSRWIDFALTMDTPEFKKAIQLAQKEIKSYREHKGDIEDLENVSNLFGEMELRAAFFIDGMSDFLAKREYTPCTLGILEAVDERREELCSAVNDANETVRLLEEKKEVELKFIDQQIDKASEHKKNIINQALATMPDNFSLLLPEITKQRLATLPGHDCTICTVRLSWPSDAALLGPENCHLAVMLKCCCQFVGESCARRLLSQPQAKCPFCRKAPLVVDGSINKVTF
jgi:hypothetical protein